MVLFDAIGQNYLVPSFSFYDIQRRANDLTGHLTFTAGCLYVIV